MGFLSQIERSARSVPGIVGGHDLRAEVIGPDTVHTDRHSLVPRGLPIEAADRIAEAVDRQVHRGANPGYCSIHMEAAEVEPAAGGG